MMEMQKDTDNTLESPFQDAQLLENFYAGAGRGDLLKRMKSAVESGEPLMVLTRSEGCGKTHLCRMLEAECPSSIVVSYFPGTVESFEDVVRIIAERVGLALPAVDEGRTVDAAVEQIITYLLRSSKGLLVIFDEAENLYLATLERIRKMLDRIIASGGRMQILFSGRKTFLENCEQLSICDFRNTENLHFDVSPLTEQETSDYLQFCLQRLAYPEKRKIFNDEVVRNIHNLAKGKLRRINMLADESLRSHGDDTSFMVLLDSVQDEAETEEEKQQVRRFGLGRMSPYIWWIGGALCTVILLSLFLRPGEERRTMKPVSLSASANKTKVEAIVKTGGGQQQDPVPAVIQQTAQPTGQPVQPPEQSPEVLVEKLADKPPLTTPPAATEKTKLAENSQETLEQPPAAVQPPLKAEREQPAPVKEKIVKAAEAKIPELRQNPPLKVRPTSVPESTVTVPKAQPRQEAQESPAATAHLTVDQLYQKRLAAGTVWAIGEKNDKFTVQLMVLTAKNAELNIKKMLAQPNYRQEAGNFFIFKKNGSPEVVWVFYGEYPTLDLARLAQNSLPQFLRDHQPYAISVKGAVAKVGK